MESFIFCAVLGVMISVLGVMNMCGNISSLHFYHRQRVSPENVKPFGKLVGLGTLIIGISVIIFSLLSIPSIDVLTMVGTVIMILGIAVGLGLSFYAMKKYNGGIF